MSTANRNQQRFPHPAPRQGQRSQPQEVIVLDDSDSSSDEENISTRGRSTGLQSLTNTFRKKLILIDDDDSSSDSSVAEVTPRRPNRTTSGPSYWIWRHFPDRKEYGLECTESKLPFPKFGLPQKLYDTLYDFQLDGVKWIASLNNHRVVGTTPSSSLLRGTPLRAGGGILADDMGMGKTYVSLSVLGGLMRGGAIQNALVIAPVSLLRNWENESKHILRHCVRTVCISVVSSNTSERERKRILGNATNQRQKGTCHMVITTYGLARSAQQDFVCPRHSRDAHRWDYVLLDEAHTIKNPKAAVTKSCHAICHDPATRRLMLSGTPILNNLTELWCLFDFATTGAVLGSLKSFQQDYAGPIEQARDASAGPQEMALGETKNRQLQTLLKPFFLQRLKVDYLKERLPEKRDFVVWTHLSNLQRELYQEFLNKNDDVYDILRGKKISPLIALTHLKKLCSHPMLVQTEDDDDETRVITDSNSTIMAQSAKLGVLVKLINQIRFHHRTLIFSQSTKMLNIIESLLQGEGVSLLRIDGKTKEQHRQRNVDNFNKEGSKVEVMLLSTKAAGVGLTLTGADTVVVYDPSWTPAEDSQAIDRAYRLGQKKPVTVYRLITAGTVEEKMYERQIHKDGIRRTVFGVEGESVQRYFKRNELKELFKLGDPGVCHMMEKVYEAMRGQTTDWRDQEHLFSMDGIVGLSRHDGFYSFSESEGTGKNVFEDAADRAPRVFGRSQKVMERDKENQELIALGPKTSASRKQNSTRVDVTQQLLNRTEDVAPPTLQEQITQAEASNQPRLALKLCLDMLASPEFPGQNRERKLELHNKISQLSASMGLFAVK